MRAGQLNTRLRFFKRVAGNDLRGNRRTDFQEQFEVWADMRLRPGSEAFTAARLEGRVPYSVVVRRTPQTEAITTGWMARDQEGRDYSVQSPAPDHHDRGAIHMLLVLNARSV